MNQRQVVIVDFALGNQISVQRIVRNLGYRCSISDQANQIEDADLVIIPGVGAFPAAMKMLYDKQLVSVLGNRYCANRSILGICLGMQLLVDESEELGLTQGLGFIPGRVKPLRNIRWHIGWNTVGIKLEDEVFSGLDKKAFYFNHSYVYEGSDEFVVATTEIGDVIPAVIRRGNIVGLQFHPEKSQQAGYFLLSNLISSLCEMS